MEDRTTTITLYCILTYVILICNTFLVTQIKHKMLHKGSINTYYFIIISHSTKSIGYTIVTHLNIFNAVIEVL